MNNKQNCKTNILDCTFRDGGYYNNWSFKKKDINFYLNKISKTKIKYIEIGFRFLNNKKSGLTAYSKDFFLKNLNNKKNLKIGVMINASDFIFGEKLDLKKLKKMFPSYKYFSFVRVAFHYSEVKKVNEIVNFFNKSGLEIMVNLMQVSELSNKALIKILIILNKSNIKTFYIADSLGSLLPKCILRISNILKKHCKFEIGFHAHDNMNLAFANAKMAIKEKFDFVDSTILGMGRGAGNLKTEHIYSYINNDDKLGKSCLEKIKKKIFINLKKKYKWGGNIYYKFAAKNSIHPTYVQELLNNKKYSFNEYFKILNLLAKINAKKYDVENIAQHKESIYNKKNLKKIRFVNKKFLILGSSPDLSKYKKSIYKFFKNLSPSVIALNTNRIFPDKFISYRLASHNKRINMEYRFYSNFKNKFIIPFNKIDPKILNYLKKKNVNIYNYNLQISKNKKVLVNENKCFLPNTLVMGYAISFAISRGAKKIYLAGFKGFDRDSFFSDESESTLKLFKHKYKNVAITSVTPTKFHISYKKIS
jgi:4-hydroxy 2-oxovalerate aldolase